MTKGKPNPNWRKKVKEWESSNKPPKVWCKENQIPYSTLRGWRDRLKKLNKNHISTKPDRDFVELKESTESDPGITIDYYGARIQLKRGFDDIVLKECLRCLRGVLC